MSTRPVYPQYYRSLRARRLERMTTACEAMTAGFTIIADTMTDTATTDRRGSYYLAALAPSPPSGALAPRLSPMSSS